MAKKHDIHVFVVDDKWLEFSDANGTEDRSTIHVKQGHRVKWLMRHNFGTLQVTWKVNSPFSQAVLPVGPNGASPEHTVTNNPANYDYTAIVTVPGKAAIIQDPRISIDPNTSFSTGFIRGLAIFGTAVVAVVAVAALVVALTDVNESER